jgi:hypothetical protein
METKKTTTKARGGCSRNNCGNYKGYTKTKTTTS